MPQTGKVMKNNSPSLQKEKVPSIYLEKAERERPPSWILNPFKLANVRFWTPAAQNKEYGGAINRANIVSRPFKRL